MKKRNYSKRDPIKNYFPLPNEIYYLGLKAGEIVIYGYLLHIENRETHQCWPSYKTIGKAVNMSENTVRKYVQGLREKGFIMTEQTKVTLSDGTVRNGTLLYTVLPIQVAIDRFYEKQFSLDDMKQEQRQTAKRKAQYESECTATT